MKRIISALLIICLSIGCFTGCGKKNKDNSKTESPKQDQVQEQQDLKNLVLKVDINMENLYEYFEYKEYPGFYKEDDGTDGNHGIDEEIAEYFQKTGHRIGSNNSHYRLQPIITHEFGCGFP